MFVHRLLLHSDIVINYHKPGLCRSVVYGVVRCSAAPKPIYTFAIGNILMVSRGVYWCVGFDQYIFKAPHMQQYSIYAVESFRLQINLLKERDKNGWSVMKINLFIPTVDKK